MNSTTQAYKFIAATTLVLTAIGPCAAAEPVPKTVTVFADEAVQATDQTSTYEANCPSGKYRLRVNRNAKRVEFEFAGATRSTTDLSGTPFGAAALRGLTGKYHSTCPNGALRLYFDGFEPVPGAALKPVTSRTTLQNNGVIADYTGLLETATGSLNARFLLVEEE